ncbi:MAG TPA: hypothetical protein VK095_00110 [Beutenbergiaceae bacterium]|nr:hypothetical protein [Beutenbergiaceae bacterium]
MPADLGLLDAELAWGHHLLVVSAQVEADDVEALALSRFPGASRRDAHTIDLLPGAWLTGPWRLDDGARTRLGLPEEADGAYLARAPVQRSGPVPEELRGLGGMLDAFPEGPPERTEAEVVTFLLAAARRLGAGLRAGGSGVLVLPDPAEIPDLLVHAPVWLDPDALLVVLRPVLPDVRLIMEAGPAPLPRAAGTTDDPERLRLHAEADAFDAAALAGEEVREAYGAISRFPDDGVISVSVEAQDPAPLTLAGTDWARDGVLTYALRWYPAEDAPRPQEKPSAAYLSQREQARDLIERGATSLLSAVGGSIADDDGFLVEL